MKKFFKSLYNFVVNFSFANSVLAGSFEQAVQLSS